MPSDLYRVSLDDIQAASERISGRVRRTQLIHSQSVSKRLGTNAYLTNMPVCRAQGVYTLNALGEHPTCSVGGAHALP